ncbi:VA3 protein, partial [Acromyrmex heyeri]
MEHISMPFNLKIILAFSINSIATDDYCDVKTCKIKGPHTMCTYTSSEPSATCEQVYKVGVTDEDINTILAVHNELRQKVASGKENRENPGSWNKELANIAQRWANQCNYNHDACRDIGTYTYNYKLNVQFIYYFYLNVLQINIKMQMETGHYTQIVWAETTDVGCGFITYKNNQWNTSYIVCNYSPAGNMRNGRIYEIAN